MTAPTDAKACVFCNTRVSTDTQKCPGCQEWLVPTEPIGPGGGLNAIAAIWMLVSVLGGLFSLIAGNEYSFAIGLAVILQGVLVGLAGMALASMVPRRPKPIAGA